MKKKAKFIFHKVPKVEIQLQYQERATRKNGNERGNLIGEIKIMVPKSLTKEEKEIFEKLDKISKFNPRKT